MDPLQNKRPLAMTAKHSLEGVALVRLLHSLQDGFVDSEANGGREAGEGQVGHHTDDAELGQGEEQQQEAAEHDPCLLDVTPVQEVDSWGEKINTLKARAGRASRMATMATAMLGAPAGGKREE